MHSSTFEAAQFNPTLVDPHWGGARFDATAADPYGYLYAGSDSACAVAELLLRDLPLEPDGTRFLTAMAIADIVLSRLVLSTDIPLISLCDGSDLGRIGQGDTWLVSCSSQEYGYTRRWAHALRGWAPEAQGLVWLSRRDPAKRSYVFFEDRFSATFNLDAENRVEETEGLPPVPGQVALASADGRRYLQTLLGRYSVTLPP